MQTRNEILHVPTHTYTRARAHTHKFPSDEKFQYFPCSNRNHSTASADRADKLKPSFIKITPSSTLLPPYLIAIIFFPDGIKTFLHRHIIILMDSFDPPHIFHSIHSHPVLIFDICLYNLQLIKTQ